MIFELVGSILIVLTTGQKSTNSCASSSAEINIQTTAGHIISATLRLPRSTNKSAVVLLVGGAGPSAGDYSTVLWKASDDAVHGNHAFNQLADSLVCSGLGTLRFDEVGVGKSTGNYFEYATTETLANDVADIVENLKLRTDVDGNRIVLLGHSEGGAIAAIVAAKDRSVAGVILMASPSVSGDSIMKLQWAHLLQLNEGPMDSLLAKHAQRIRNEMWYRHFLRYDPSRAYRSLQMPVLILQGERDSQVTPDQAEHIRESVQSNGNVRSECVRFVRLDHTFSDEKRLDRRLDPDAIRTIINWVRATIGQNKPITTIHKSECEFR